MALPELLANSPNPGVREPLTTLAEALSEAGLSLKLAAKLPVALQGPGQTRLLIDNEIILIEATSETTVTILERGAEGSTKKPHVNGSQVYHILTTEGATRAFTLGASTAASAYRSTTQKIPTASPTRIKLDKTIFDLGSNYNIVEGFYVAPATGYYSVAGVVSIALTAVAEATFIVSIFVNGAERIRGHRFEGKPVGSGLCNGTAAGILKLAKGDKVELIGWQFTGAERELELAENENRLDVVRVA
jgi:hypothetical protein